MKLKQRQSRKRQVSSHDIDWAAAFDLKASRTEFWAAENSTCVFVDISSQRSWGSGKAVWVLLEGRNSP